MLYTNYKQVAEIVLNSQDAEKVDYTPQPENLILWKGGSVVMKHNEYLRKEDGTFIYHPLSPLPSSDYTYENPPTDGKIFHDPYSPKLYPLYFTKKFSFKINLLNPMSKNLKIAVKSFSIHNTTIMGSDFYSWDNSERSIGNVYIDNVYDKNSFNSDPDINNKFELLTFPMCQKPVDTYFNNDILNSAKSIQNNIFQNNYLDIVVDAKIKNSDNEKIKGIPQTARWSLSLILFDTEFQENPKLENYGRMPIMPPKIMDLS